MKGFPNQVADLPTLTRALRLIDTLTRAGKDAKDDGVYGEELVRSGVLGTGHKPIPVETYLAQQKAIPRRSDQSYRTRARGLRQLFRILGLVDDSDTAGLTAAGRQVAALPAGALDANGLRIWRAAILNMTHDGGDATRSHPYQVMLRLVANRPGITRAKCAIALEAKDDSETELSRITALSDLDEAAILTTIGVTKPNWNNAKKILPKLAEQLGDVRKEGERFFLNESPGETAPAEPQTGGAPATTRRPRRPSAVTSATIATTRAVVEWDEVDTPPETPANPQQARERAQRITDRFNRHQAVVRHAARALAGRGAELFEQPFDCLARFPTEAVLVEVKSLDGTTADERERVCEALSQILYYSAFAARSLLGNRRLERVACFEGPISGEHAEWLESHGAHVIWRHGDGFDATPAARAALSRYFGF